MSVTLIVDFQVKPDMLTAFGQLLLSVSHTLPGKGGCEELRVLSGAEDSCAMTLIEVWQSKAHHQAHVEGIVASGEWDAILSHLSEAPRAAYYTVL